MFRLKFSTATRPIPGMRRFDYLVCYDSPDDSRRARLLGSVRGFGIDPQYSFHECALTHGELGELWSRMAAGVEPEDKLLAMRLAPEAEGWRLGRKPKRDGPPRPLVYVG